jgi:DeoR/GlpR family transcriptional regulator of sugar metabolism
MWSPERHAYILQSLQRRQRLSIDECALSMGVSKETVRRDLIELEQQGQLLRVHGGAVLPASAAEPPFEVRSRWRTEEKSALTRAALARLEPGMCLLMDAGTTTLAMAHALSQAPALFVVTNSIAAAAVIHQQPQHQLMLIGGPVSSHYPATSGEQAMDAVRRIRADLAILSPSAFGPQLGPANYIAGEAMFAQALLQQSRQHLLLADSTKLRHDSRHQICPPSQVQCLITDSKASADELARIRAQGVGEVVVV